MERHRNDGGCAASTRLYLMTFFESQTQAQNVDKDRRQYILSFVSYISGTVILLYGLPHLMSGNVALASLLLGTSLTFLLTVVYYHRTGDIDLACKIEALLVVGFVLTLIYHGGYRNTALYWIFPFPLILFGLLGVRNALISNAVVLLAIAVMLFAPDWIRAEYRVEETTRFYASLVITVIAAGINDYFRERSHHKMSALQLSREQQANTDPLTLLPNRRFIDASLQRQMNRTPEEFLPLGVVMCDIDHFKQLNDQFGHQAGDHVLREVARLFRKTLRRQDIACRTGGEEFLIFLPRTELVDVRIVAEKVRVQLAKTVFPIKGKAHRITASFGTTVCHNTGELSAAVERADEQLYNAKKSGRNQVV